MTNSNTFQSSRLIQILIKRYRELNLSLVYLPPYKHEDYGEICFLGPNGETDVESITFCRDLPFGMAGSVGSWFLPPERHILEGLIVFIISLVTIQLCLGKSYKWKSEFTTDFTKLRPPAFLRAATLICFMLQCVYKGSGYPNKILSMLLPCNVLWFMAVTLSFSKASSVIMHSIIQLLVTYFGLPLLALSQPDTSDCVLLGEKLFFFVHHSLLVTYPLYYVSVGYELGGIKEQIRWIFLGSAFFAMFYVCFVTPICVITGLNLNYMLHPSMDLVNGGISGQWFRWLSMRNLVILFSATRVIMTILAQTSQFIYARFI